MGGGFHGGFGNTYGKRAISASPVFVGRGKGEELARAARSIKPESGYIDVVIHGTPNSVAYMHNGKWQYLDQRRLVNILRHSKDFTKNKAIRLISCSTGENAAGFAQNLANKLGVKVKAPSDTLWILPGGVMKIGPSPTKNTGKWIIFKPYRKGDK